MKHPGSFLVAVSLCLVVCASGVAQNSSTVDPLQQANQPKSELADHRQAEKTSIEPAKELQQDPFVQKLKQIRFDRRPSTILKAWSHVPTAPDPKTDPVDVQLHELKHSVTLGHWERVRHYLAGLEPKHGSAVYQHLLQSLGSSAPRQGSGPSQQPNPSGRQFQERNLVSVDDVVSLIRLAPQQRDDAILGQLGTILAQSVSQGYVIEAFIDQFQRELALPQDTRELHQREIAKILLAAGQPQHVGEFLPTAQQAADQQDLEALNLLARHYMARHASEGQTAFLEQAWSVTQAILAMGAEVEQKQREEALTRSVELAPKVREELGQAWLVRNFTEQPRQGMEIIAAIGNFTSRGLQSHPQNPSFRLKGLQLQSTAVEALLAASPQLADQWKTSLNLLAVCWLKEAEFSYRYDRSISIGPRMRVDAFGNPYYVDDAQLQAGQVKQNRPRAIAIGDVLTSRPSAQWIDRLDVGIRPKFSTVFAQLFLKVNEEAKAFPYIEQLAQTHSPRARQLVDEFLRVWARNHDPNSARHRNNPYLHVYGFNAKASGIPLTRSKQQRNLAELAQWVQQIRQLPIGQLNEDLLIKAFTHCYSSAEVYDLDAIQQVFGAKDELSPSTLAGLAQQMRSNLATLWRAPAIQERQRTKRKKKDIESEVLRGYLVARQVVEEGLGRHPDHWRLLLVKAALQHDENDYRSDIAKTSTYSNQREQAFDAFAKAAESYAQSSDSQSMDRESVDVYLQWFYAGLGACDLNQINETRLPNPRQPERIRQSILALPPDVARRHLAKFANALMTRMNSVSPAVKYRYLRTGFEIAGDHHQAREARKVLNYYEDLVTELKLETLIDGKSTVGHQEPFGVFVNLRHTREIERESGGFSRYLQNQNNVNNSYNYGRPTENYRDKFQEAAQKALEEHFEILSVTFQQEDVNSRAIQPYGWRVTPYAYLLLKARGPKVDRVPSLRLDLDFLDSTGYVILPIESPILPIDAHAAQAQRPFTMLELTQTLDERQASKGRLILEVKAKAHGLVPTLEDLVDLKPDGFHIEQIEDQGLAVSRFDPDSEDSLIISERQWLVTMTAHTDASVAGQTFTFQSPQLPVNQVAYQRYDDADLVEVGQSITLLQNYGNSRWAWQWIVAAVIAVIVAFVGVAVLVWFLLRSRGVQPSPHPLLDQVTPLTVLGLLKQIHRNNGLDSVGKGALAGDIRLVERYYFSSEEGDEPDLQAIAYRWSRQSS